MVFTFSHQPSQLSHIHPISPPPSTPYLPRYIVDKKVVYMVKESDHTIASSENLVASLNVVPTAGGGPGTGRIKSDPNTGRNGDEIKSDQQPSSARGGRFTCLSLLT